jgi:hypothetical protein
VGWRYRDDRGAPELDIATRAAAASTGGLSAERLRRVHDVLDGGGVSTLWQNDPREEMIPILMTQRGWESSTPAGVFVDFWTLAYAAIDD